MKLKAPKQLTFGIAVLLAVIGVVVKLVKIQALSAYPGWLLLIAFIILALGNLIPAL